ncbi:MAG: protein phosphatase 2C domain-containing protein [Desulforhopalus sp.]
MHIQYAARSEIGLKRNNNEDSYKIELCDGQTSPQINNSMLFAVADGMGGHPCGEVASMMACESLKGFLDTPGKISEKKVQSILVKIFFYIDDQIKLYTRKNPDCLHMGTTLSVIVILGEKAVIAHVGDTRIYRLHDGKLRLLTTDHTFVQEMVEKGALTTEMAATSPHRNVLTEVVGTDEPLENVFTQTLDLVPGDRFLLSSDGLHGSVSFQDIELMMEKGNDPEETARRLLTRTMVEGGQDDITLIVVFTS